MNKGIIYTSAVSLIVMAAAAVFAYGMIHSQLVNPADPVDTYNNIQSHIQLFRIEILLWLVILITDIFASWGLYIIFASMKKNEITHRNLSLLAALFRIMYTAMLGTGIYSLAMIQTSETAAQTAAYLQGFESIWGLGLIIFGFHLLLLGIVGLKQYLPKTISILLVIAGIAYSFIHLFKFAAPELNELTDTIEMIFMLPMTAAELGLALWLLIRGKKTLLNPA